MKEILHIYSRVSTSIQEEEGTSLSTQQQYGIKRANKLGMDYKIWNEGAKSSSKDDLTNRPILTDILNQISQGNIRHLYVWNTDRLSRNLNTWGMIRLKLIQNNITLHTPTGKQILSDPQTNLMIGIMSEIAQYDNLLRTERFRIGKFEKIKQGYWMGGPPPYGYKIIDSKLVPNKDEVKWVNFIFESYKNFQSIDEIRTNLMNNGVITRRGNPIWTHGSINKLLTNTHYSGYYTYTDHKTQETIRIICEPIISSNLYLQVQKMREKRSYKTLEGKRVRTSVQKHIYLLNDLLICAHCGSRFGGNYKTTQTSYYACSQKTHKFKTKYTDDYVDCASKRNIRIDKTDKLIWDTITDTLSSSNTFKDMIKQNVLEGKSYNLSQKNIDKFQKQVKKIDLEISKILDSITSLEVNKIIKSKSEKESNLIIKKLEQHRLELESEKENILKQLKSQKDNVKWVDWVKEFSKKIKNLKDETMNIEEKKKFLDGIVEKILITSIDKQLHEIKICYKFPFFNDVLEWNNIDNKSKGYKIKNGLKEQIIKSNLLQKKRIF